jgi:hypothetical protein
MAMRVVMPREVRRRRAFAVMWLMWSRRGYSCRPCPGSAAKRGWVVVEFWIEAPTASVDTLASYEWELDDALLGLRVRADFGGRGSRLDVG